MKKGAELFAWAAALASTNRLDPAAVGTIAEAYVHGAIDALADEVEYLKSGKGAVSQADGSAT